MKILKKISIQSLCLVAVLGVAACSPSVNPAMKTSVDGQVTSIQISPQVYDGNAPAVGYEAGAWLRYKSVDDKGYPSINTYKLLKSEGNVHTIESVLESYYNKSSSLIELQYEFGAPIGSMQILSAVTQIDNDTPTVSSSMELSMMGSMYRTMIGHLFYREQNAGTASTQVPAGQFNGCQEKDSTMQIGPMSYSAHSWHHAAVPMHGMVRSERTDGKPGTTELVSFGLTGARSEILEAMR